MLSTANVHRGQRRDKYSSPPLFFYVRVVCETIIAATTLVFIALAIFLFISGSDLLQSNRARTGVRLSQFTYQGTTRVYGTFTARSDCTRVDLTTEDLVHERALYLTEVEEGDCPLYVNQLPYTFTVIFDGALQVPIAVYMNGERISTTSN